MRAKPDDVIPAQPCVAGAHRGGLPARPIREHSLAPLSVRLDERGASCDAVSESGAACHIQATDDAVARPLRADDVPVHLWANALILTVGTDA